MEPSKDIDYTTNVDQFLIDHPPVTREEFDTLKESTRALAARVSDLITEVSDLEQRTLKLQHHTNMQKEVMREEMREATRRLEKLERGLVSHDLCI